MTEWIRRTGFAMVILGFLITLSPWRVFKTAVGAWLGFFAIGLVHRGSSPLLVRTAQHRL